MTFYNFVFMFIVVELIGLVLLVVAVTALRHFAPSFWNCAREHFVRLFR